MRVWACRRKHHHGCANSAYGGYEGEGWDTCPSCYYLVELSMFLQYNRRPGASVGASPQARSA